MAYDNALHRVSASKVGCRGRDIYVLIGQHIVCLNSFYDSSFKTKRIQRFQYWFDCYCEHAFLNCMNSYNDYSQPLLVPDDFMNYLNLSKRIFPQQWEFLTTARGIYSRYADNLQDYKEHQIFMVLLNLH